MKWIKVTGKENFTDISVIRFVSTKTVLHNAAQFISKYPHRINDLEYLDETERFPSPSADNGLIEALQKIQQLIPEGADYDPGQFVMEIEGIAGKALAQYNAVEPEKEFEKAYNKAINDIIEYCNDSKVSPEFMNRIYKFLKSPDEVLDKEIEAIKDRLFKSGETPIPIEPEDKTDLGIYENFKRETTIEPEGIDETYIRKFLINNRVIRTELQDEYTQLLLLFYNHITRK